MQTSDLAGVLMLDAVWSFDRKTQLVAVGPLTIQPGSTPFRTVIANKGKEFVVWDEMVPNYPSGEGAGFTNGQYFGVESFPKAMEAFGERVAQESDSVQSIYRSVEVA